MKQLWLSVCVVLQRDVSVYTFLMATTRALWRHVFFYPVCTQPNWSFVNKITIIRWGVLTAFSETTHLYYLPSVAPLYRINMAVWSSSTPQINPLILTHYRSLPLLVPIPFLKSVTNTSFHGQSGANFITSVPTDKPRIDGGLTFLTTQKPSEMLGILCCRRNAFCKSNTRWMK